MMASGDDVVVDNWEEADDSGELDRQLDATLKIYTKRESSSRQAPGAPVVARLLLEEDSGRTKFTPQIRILKRPSDGDGHGGGGGAGTTARAAPPMKPLAQREAEYAEARRRILGSSPPPDDQEEEEQQGDCPPTHRPTAKPLVSGGAGEEAAAAALVRRQQQQQQQLTGVVRGQQQQQQQLTGVVRAPRGPDGTRGFTQKR